MFSLILEVKNDAGYLILTVFNCASDFILLCWVWTNIIERIYLRCGRFGFLILCFNRNGASIVMIINSIVKN